MHFYSTPTFNKINQITVPHLFPVKLKSSGTNLDNFFEERAKMKIPTRIFPPLQMCRRSGMSHRKQFLELHK